MKLSERVDYLRYICELLQDTTSRNEKEQIVNDIDKNVKDDFDFILEVLDGRHPIGYTFIAQYPGEMSEENELQSLTFKEYITPLWLPTHNGDWSRASIAGAVNLVKYFNDFIEPIVNRTLRLGISKSVLVKEDTSPMLAKKFDPEKILMDKNGYFITEKLDGNRCIAVYLGNRWQFMSRNGKPMKVNFDMTGLPTQFIYDGEVTSPIQTRRSIAFEQVTRNPYEYNAHIATKSSTDDFQVTSGLINSKSTDKDLIYNIFDICNTKTNYVERRKLLDSFTICSKNVRVLKVLQSCHSKEELAFTTSNLLDFITSNGGEGIMINLGSGEYVQTRTGLLLKYKKVQTMDMQVIDLEPGEGKYEGLVGALICQCKLADGNTVSCKVGTGLTDEQRSYWAMSNDRIIGKIVEVAYFSLSKTGVPGCIKYSLRFPRLKRVRYDKSGTSQF